MHAILKHCYFKAPLFHYKILLGHDSSIGASESLSDRTSSLKSSSKCLLIDLDTPLSPWQGLVRLQNQISGFKKKLRNIRALVLEGFIDGSQNVVRYSEMSSASLQNYENRSK